MRFGTLVGTSVDVPEGSAGDAELAHEYQTPQGSEVLVLRNDRGHFIKGCQMHLIRDPANLGSPVKNPKTRLRRALGLPANDWSPNVTFPRRKR